MTNLPKDLQRNPLKLCVQDVFSAKETEYKYIYELFGLNFKNVMIHGVVTSVYNVTSNTMNLELSDPTGTVQIYYDSTKNNMNISESTLTDLRNNYIDESKFGDPNISIMTVLMERIIEKKSVAFEEGCHINVVGDIFVDSNTRTRMISAYECSKTSVEFDIVWMEELRYLYDRLYLRNKV